MGDVVIYALSAWTHVGYSVRVRVRVSTRARAHGDLAVTEVHGDDVGL